MNISATIAKTKAIRVVLACAVFCASALCSAQETARGIVAEKIDTAKNDTERPEPEIHFQLGHSGSVYSVVWSPDGKHIASGSYDNSVKIWDAASGKELRTLKGHSEWVFAVAWSPDGKHIASGSVDNSVKIWDATSGKEVRTLSGHSKTVRSVAWSPDGKYIASGSSDKTVKIWGVRTSKELYTLSGYSDEVCSVAWSPDGKYIVTGDGGSDDGTVRIWNATNGEVIRELLGHSSAVVSVAWSPDGKYIAGGSVHHKGTLKIWDASNGKLLRTLLDTKSNNVHSVAWSPNGKYIASTNGDYHSALTIWESESWKEELSVKPFNYSYSSFQSIAWSPDGKRIVGGDYDSTIKILDAQTGNKLRTLSSHSSNVYSVSWSPDGKCIVSGSDDGKYENGIIKIWNSQTGKELCTLTGHYCLVSSVSWSSDGKYIASGGMLDSTIKIWDAQTGKEVLTLSGDFYETNSVTWSPEGKYIASGSGNKEDAGIIKIWNLQTGKELRTFTGHYYWVTSVSWSPDGRYIASGSHDDDNIRIWDIKTGKELRILSGHPSPVESVAWSPDGKHIASGSWDNSVKIWDAASGKELRTLSGHSGDVESVAWSPDGKYIVSGGDDHTVKIWDMTSRKELRTLIGHSDDVESVAWSPNGKYVASGSRDGTIKIWNAQTGTLLSTTINGKDGEWLTYTPEGFFCGSEWATQNLVYIVDGMDVIGIDQVYDTYYRPDLVAAKMRGEDISAYASSVRLASLVRSGRAPTVSLLGIPAESSGRDMTFDISVRNTGGGIGAVNLLLNGKAIRLSDGIASADGETISFRHTVTLQNGSNTLEAFALNGAELVESVRSSAQVVWHGATEKPDLYVLTAAVNRYRDKSLWLNYAVPDAQSVAAGFQKQKSGLYRNVHVSQLNDGDVTKEKLAAEFSRLSEHIRADDVFVFFVSGHGTTYDDGDYYYLPSDFRYTSKDSIPNGGISKNDLLANLSKIKAGKTLVMLDTCNSGAFLSDSNKRGLSEKTAIDRLTRATGHATLAASSDTQSAMEGYNGHGVFTYVFLEGIAGAADSDGDGYVTLNELSTFVEREVPERSYEKWGYEQVPQKDLRRQDFPIAGK